VVTDGRKDEVVGGGGGGGGSWEFGDDGELTRAQSVVWWWRSTGVS
jgi:hypothetical protein